VFCVEGESGEQATVLATARLVLDLLERSVQDQQLQRLCRQQAAERLGSMGGAEQMATAISALLTSTPSIVPQQP
jgi:hypothetical protein